jgi:hypothetical protein
MAGIYWLLLILLTVAMWITEIVVFLSERPRRFSLRALLIAMTITAVAMRLIASLVASTSD